MNMETARTETDIAHQKKVVARASDTLFNLGYDIAAEHKALLQEAKATSFDEIKSENRQIVYVKAAGLLGGEVVHKAVLYLPSVQEDAENIRLTRFAEAGDGLVKIEENTTVGKFIETHRWNLPLRKIQKAVLYPFALIKQKILRHG